MRPRKQKVEKVVVPEPVEEEEDEEEVELNPSYDDFAVDQSTVILPDSSHNFFTDDLQFGSLSLNEKPKGEQNVWSDKYYVAQQTFKNGSSPQQQPQQLQQQQNVQFEKKKQNQKFVPQQTTQQPFYGNPYMNPYMNPYQQNPYYGKNPYYPQQQQQQQHGTQQQGQDVQGHLYYQQPPTQQQMGKDDKHKVDNFESPEMQGFNPYGGMQFHMYNPYSPQPFMNGQPQQQPQVQQKGQGQQGGQKTEWKKNF